MFVYANTDSLRKDNFSSAVLVRTLSELGISEKDRLLVAYSGGCDSTALLYALKESGWPFVRVIHVHHGLSEQAEVWAQAALATAQACGFACEIIRVKVCSGHRGLEAAARSARYQALQEHMYGGEVVVLGHHADDQAETVLLQLLRGTGVHGVAGMELVSSWGVGRLVRPLLRISRAALRHYAQTQGLAWFEDPSNRDTRFSRNYIRQQVLPILCERWPQAVHALGRNARHVRAAQRALADYVEEDVVHCCDHQGALLLTRWAVISPVRQPLVLRAWLARWMENAPEERSLVALMEALMQRPRSCCQIIPFTGGVVRRYQDLAWWGAPPIVVPHAPEVRWSPPGLLDWAPSVCFVVQSDIGIGWAAARLKGHSLHVRVRKEGERVYVPGRGHRALKKFLQEIRIPPWERDHIPLIFDGEALIGVGSVWVCPFYKATPTELGWLLVVRS